MDLSSAGHVRGTALARRPVRFVLVLVLGVVAAYLAAGTVTHLLGLPPQALVAMADVILLAVGGAVLWRRGGVRAAGIRPQPWRRAFALSAPLFLAAGVTLVLALIYGGDWRPAALLPFLLLAVLVGATEEVLFRGLAYGALRQLGIGRAVALSAALFGLLHLLNLGQGAGALATVLQVLYAFALGCAFAAALEAGGRLVPLIAAHAATDLFAFVAGGGVVNGPGHETLTAIITVFYIVVFGSYAAWVLRPPRLQAAPASR